MCELGPGFRWAHPPREFRDAVPGPGPWRRAVFLHPIFRGESALLFPTNPPRPRPAVHLREFLYLAGQRPPWQKPRFQKHFLREEVYNPETLTRLFFCKTEVRCGGKYLCPPPEKKYCPQKVLLLLGAILILLIYPHRFCLRAKQILLRLRGRMRFQARINCVRIFL